jgi:energy-converting hydrogenase Eha subunit H
MKTEILNKGLDSVIDSKQRNINNLVFITFVMTLTAFICAVLLSHQTKKVEAMEFQISQRDSIIHMHEAHINELTYDNINLANNR